VPGYDDGNFVVHVTSGLEVEKYCIEKQNQTTAISVVK
jgi:hypothetical protein